MAKNKKKKAKGGPEAASAEKAEKPQKEPKRPKVKKGAILGVAMTLLGAEDPPAARLDPATGTLLLSLPRGQKGERGPAGPPG